MTIALDRWITVKPNGPNAKGAPVQISEGGIIQGGMGGKFDGQHISKVHGEKGRANSRASAHAAFAVDLFHAAEKHGDVGAVKSA